MMGGMVLAVVAFVMIAKTRQSAQPPTIQDILREGDGKGHGLEVIVQCARILLAFLQVRYQHSYDTHRMFCMGSA